MDETAAALHYVLLHTAIRIPGKPSCDRPLIELPVPSQLSIV